MGQQENNNKTPLIPIFLATTTLFVGSGGIFGIYKHLNFKEDQKKVTEKLEKAPENIAEARRGIGFYENISNKSNENYIQSWAERRKQQYEEALSNFQNLLLSKDKELAQYEAKSKKVKEHIIVVKDEIDDLQKEKELLEQQLQDASPNSEPRIQNEISEKNTSIEKLEEDLANSKKEDRKIQAKIDLIQEDRKKIEGSISNDQEAFLALLERVAQGIEKRNRSLEALLREKDRLKKQKEKELEFQLAQQKRLEQERDLIKAENQILKEKLKQKQGGGSGRKVNEGEIARKKDEVESLRSTEVKLEEELEKLKEPTSLIMNSKDFNRCNQIYSECRSTCDVDIRTCNVDCESKKARCAIELGIYTSFSQQFPRLTHSA